MFLNELLKASYLKEEAPTDEEITVLPAGVKPGVDCNLVVTRQSFEQVLVTYRTTEPASEGILMAIGTAYDMSDPVWETLLQNEAVVNHYTNLSSVHYAKKLADLEQEEKRQEEEVIASEAPIEDAPVTFEHSADGATAEPEETSEEIADNPEGVIGEVEVSTGDVDDVSTMEEVAEEKQEYPDAISDTAAKSSDEEDEAAEKHPVDEETPEEEVEEISDEEASNEEVEATTIEVTSDEEETSPEETSVGDALHLDDDAFKPAEELSEADDFAPSMLGILNGTASVPVVEEETEEVAAYSEEQSTLDSEEISEEDSGESTSEEDALKETARHNVEQVLKDFVEIFSTYGADNVCAQMGTTFKEFLRELSRNSDAVGNKVLAGRDVEEVAPTSVVIECIAASLEDECFEVLEVGDIDWCNTLLKPILRIIYEE